VPHSSAFFAKGWWASSLEHVQQLRNIAREIRPNALWDLIKTLFVPAGYVVLEKARQAAWDWWVFGGLFLLSGCVLFSGRFTSSHKGPRQSKDEEPATLFDNAIPTSISAPTATAHGAPVSESLVLWKNSGNLFWLGHDLMYSMQITLHGLPREEVLRALRQSCYHLDHMGLRSDHIGHFLFDLRSMAETTQIRDWNDAFRNKLARKIESVIEQVGALAANNQKDFEMDISHSHGLDSHRH